MFAVDFAENAPTAFLPEHFWIMLLALVILFVVAVALGWVGWRLVDRMTPGNLDQELVPNDSQRAPNVALAIVVASLFLGFCFLMGCTILGVLLH